MVEFRKAMGSLRNLEKPSELRVFVHFLNIIYNSVVIIINSSRKQNEDRIEVQR